MGFLNDFTYKKGKSLNVNPISLQMQLPQTMNKLNNVNQFLQIFIIKTKKYTENIYQSAGFSPPQDN